MVVSEQDYIAKTLNGEKRAVCDALCAITSKSSFSRIYNFQESIAVVSDVLLEFIDDCASVGWDASEGSDFSGEIINLANKFVSAFHNTNVRFDNFFGFIKHLRQHTPGVIANYYDQETHAKFSACVGLFFDEFEKTAVAKWIEDETGGLRKELRESKHAILCEKKRYASIFQRIQEPAFVVDSRMCLVDVNNAFASFLGVDAREVIGKPCCDVFCEKACNLCALEVIFKKKTSLSNIEMTFSLQGEEKIIMLSGTYLGDIGLDDAGGLIIIQDLTAKKKVEKALAESEEKYRSLVENSPEVTWRSDMDGNLLYISPNVVKLTGFTPEEIMSSGPSWRFTVIHPDDTDEVREAFKSFFNENKQFDVRYRFKRKDGSWIWLHDRAGNIYERDGLFIADGVVSDITELQKVQEELEEYHDWLEDLVDERTEELYLSNDQLRREIEERQKVEEHLMKLALNLKRSNTELEQFAHVTSHDLKEPLLLIIAFSERLLRRFGDKLQGQGDEYIRRIITAARKMQQLVDSLLQLSRVTTNTQPFERIDLTDLVHEVVQDLEESINLARGRIEFGKLNELIGDRMQVRQLFQNIISNSLKYRKEDVDPVVIISTSLIGNEVCEIIIQDNGIGFEEIHANRIFNPFERIHGSGSYEGSGIGLTTCKKIVTRHGGEIIARSKPGQGSVFIIRLPVTQHTEKGGLFFDEDVNL